MVSALDKIAIGDFDQAIDEYQRTWEKAGDSLLPRDPARPGPLVWDRCAGAKFWGDNLRTRSAAVTPAD
jgi:hypothetical protein